MTDNVIYYPRIREIDPAAFDVNQFYYCTDAKHVVSGENFVGADGLYKTCLNCHRRRTPRDEVPVDLMTHLDSLDLVYPIEDDADSIEANDHVVFTCVYN